MTPATPRQRYVARVLDLYRSVPGASGTVRRADLRLAGQLHDRGVSIDGLCAAMILATARRLLRSPEAAPLAPIATLHYFLPVLEEIRATPPDEGYIAYLRHKLSSVAPAFVAAIDHRLP